MTVDALAFSPDGKRLATAAGLSVRLWHVPTYQELLVLTEPAGGVTSLAFSPDGKRLAAAGHSWGVRLWDTVPYGDRYRHAQAILDARCEADQVVDSLWSTASAANAVTTSLRQNTALSEPVRRAALNEVLRRAMRERSGRSPPTGDREQVNRKE
jgi:WD40 repeat protein